MFNIIVWMSLIWAVICGLLVLALIRVTRNIHAARERDTERYIDETLRQFFPSNSNKSK